MSKDKKKAKQEDGGSKKKDGVTLQPTSKFTVLEYPGVEQPKSKPVEEKSVEVGKEGRRAKASTGPRIKEDASQNLIGGESFLKRTPNPEWIQKRQSVYEKVKQRRKEELAQKNANVEISVTLPDGKVLTQDANGVKFTAWKTTPYDVAVAISQGLADSAVLAKVVYGNGFVSDYSLAEDGMDTVDTLMVDDDAADAPESDFVNEEKQDVSDTQVAYLWDLNRPLVGTVTQIEFLKFEASDEAKTVFWHSSAHMLGEALEHLYGSRLTIGPPLKGGFYYDSYMGTDSIKEDDCK